MRKANWYSYFWLLPIATVIGAVPCHAYSVLTHEAIVDSAWKDIEPLLKARYPRATKDDIQEAHAYVYGGCLIQDLGYVPFVPREYSDLTHYVRSGDFVTALLRGAKTLNEYAFALGSLAHYSSDVVGHKTINRITPLIYPKLRQKYGDVVTYEDSPKDHLKTEFAVDVLQVSRGLYAPNAYHDFIGFEVSQDLLERAFEDTYGFPLKDILSEDMAIGTYRFAVGSVVPEMTKIAWSSKRKEIAKASPNATQSSFIYAMPRNQYHKEWGTTYKRPGFGARALAFMIRILPKKGPLAVFAFHPLPAQGEQMFLESFADTSKEYIKLLGRVRSGSPTLSDFNLDTGDETRPGDYKLADKVYVSLLSHLSKKHFETVSDNLRTNILTYFSERNGIATTPETRTQLEGLRTAKPAPVAPSRASR